MCTGCTRNELSCNWPSTKLRTCSRKDILLNKGLPVVTSLITRGVSNTPPLPTSLLDSDRQTYIISFTMDYYLPIQVHRYQGLPSVNQSHIISMSFHSPALMNILIANAALTLNSHMTDWRTFEIESYICAVREVRQIIQDGDLKGKEDSLLATVMWLCIFEVRGVHSEGCYHSLTFSEFSPGQALLSKWDAFGRVCKSSPTPDTVRSSSVFRSLSSI